MVQWLCNHRNLSIARWSDICDIDFWSKYCFFKNHDGEPNNYLRCSQTEERLTVLGLIHSHYHAGIDVDTVCELFLQKHPCKMEPADLLFE